MNKIQVLKSSPCRHPSPSSFGLSTTLLAKAQVIMADRKPVLNIDLFRKSVNEKKGSVLEARYFAEKETGTYKALVRNSLGQREWKKLGIDNVARLIVEGYVTPGGNYWWRPNAWWEYESSRDEKTVRTYIGDAIEMWENKINSSRYYCAQNRKQDRITQMMEEMIPPVPVDFATWIHETVFPREYAFIQKPQKKNGMYLYKCTACGGSWRKKKGGGIGYIRCPRCGRQVLPSRKDKEMSAEEQVYLLQPCRGNTGTWVERAFKVRSVWELGETGGTVMIDEQIRIITRKGGHWGNCYYEVGIYADGQRMFWDKNTRGRRMKAGFLYPGTKEAVEKCWSDELKHSGIWMLAQRQRVNVNNIIINAKVRPYMEYLLKGKFYRLAGEIAKGTYKEHSYMHEGSSPEEVFLLANSGVDRIRRMDGGFTVLTWLQHERRTGTKVSQENLEWADQHGLTADNSEIKAMMKRMGSANVVLNYLRRQCARSRKSPRDVILTYKDYIRMADIQKLNLSHEIFYKPKDVYAAHDACVREGHRQEAMKRSAEILKKFPDVENVLARIREKYEYDGEEYCIVVPANIADIIHEGRALGHCIDTTDRYFDRIEQETSYLVFLRRRNAKDVPWYTLEIEPGGTVRQQRTTGNEQKKEDAKKYMPFIREWQKTVRERISEEDRILAEKSRETRILEYSELRKKKEKVWRGKLAGKLLADVLEADLVECL